MCNIKKETLINLKGINGIDPHYYTVPEVALLLGVSKSYIYEMITQKRLDAIKLSPRRTRIHASAIDKFIKQEMDNTYSKQYNKGVVQPPRRGRKSNATA